MRSTCLALEKYLLCRHGDSALPGKSFSPEHPDQMGRDELYKKRTSRKMDSQ